MVVNNNSAGTLENISKYGSLGFKILIIVCAVIFGFLIIKNYGDWQDAKAKAEQEQKDLVKEGKLEAFDAAKISENEDVKAAEAAVVGIVTTTIIVTMIFIGIGLAFTLFFGGLFLAINFKKNYKSLIAFGALAVVLLIASTMGGGTDGLKLPEDFDTFWLSVGETGIYGSFILIGLAIIGSLAGFVVKLVK